MQIKINRAVQFRDDAGQIRTGVVRDFVVVDNGMIITATVKGLPFTIDNTQIIAKAVPHIVA